MSDKPNEAEIEEFKKKAAALGFTVSNKDAKADKGKAPQHAAADDEDDPDSDEWFNPLRGSGFFHKQTLSFTKTYGDSLSNRMMVREFSNIKVDGAVIVTGFPSTSLASILTAGYLREQLKLPLVGVISSHAFAPRCIIERGLPSHSVRIFGDERLVVVLCEFKIPEAALIHTLTEALLDFASRHNSPIIVTVEGMPASDKKDPKLHFISTDKSLSETLIADGHKALEEAVVGGVTGAILSEGALSQSTGVASLLTPTSSSLPEAETAVTVVKVVVKYLSSLGHKVDVDTAPLESKAEELNKTIQHLLSSEKENTHASSAMYS